MKKNLLSIGLSILLCFMSSNVFSQGLNSDTKLLLHFEEPTDGTAPDGSFEIIDSGNTGHVVTQIADTVLQTPKVKFGSSSVKFDGTGDHLNIPDSADWDIAAATDESWTISFWIYPTSLASTSYWVSQRPGATHLLFVSTDVTPNFGFGVKLNSSYVWGAMNGGTPVINTWQHVAAVTTNTGAALYHNGVQVAYDSTLGATGTIAADLRIGGNLNTDCTGYMDELLFQKSNIYGVDITDSGDTFTPPIVPHTADANTKLLLHFDTQDGSGDGGSDSYHIPNFVADAHVDADETKWDNGALKLDGTGDLISIVDSADWDIGTNLTIDLWVKHDDHVGTEAYLEQYVDATNYWVLEHIDSTGLHFQVDGGGADIDISGGEITDTNWHHIGLIKVGSDVGIYKDGTQIVDGDSACTTAFADLLSIGARIDPTNYFAGNMDEVRIQATNYFNASPNATPDDTITAPTEAYSVAVVGGRRIFIITKFIPRKDGKGYDRIRENHWYTHKDVKI